MTLTEQWKKGELPEGWYYIRNKAHSIKFNQMALYIVYGEVKYWTECKDEDVEEVLAPVPSYEEWQKMKEQLEKAEATLLEIDGGWVTNEIKSKISEYFVFSVVGEK